MIEEYTGILSGIAFEYKLSKQFHKRLHDALVYNLKEKRSDFQTLISSLPPKVASMLKYKMNHKLIENNQFFTDKPFHFVQRILEFLNPYKAEIGEYVYKEGAPVDEIYFVLSGHVAFIYENDIIYESVQAGGYFGDAEIFLCEERETCVKCIKRTKMLTLDRDCLLGVLKEYEKVKVDMIFTSMIKRKQLKKTSIASRSETESKDIYITPEQNSAKESKFVDVSANFILDCSSSLEPKLAWD
jgi:signal-transduction protein with cAMP-binding, CBS, and nucleotidyltransferase domain